MKDMLLGRSIDYWIDVSTVLDIYGIECARELDQRLSTKSRPTGFVVVDAKNPQRVLGRIVGQRLAQLQPSQVLSMAIEPRHELRPYSAAKVDCRIEVVRFAVGRTTDDGWTYTPRLETGEPLSKLMKLKDFRLPEETEPQFSYRWRMRS